MGAIFQVPWTRIDSIGWLRELGFKTVAMVLSDTAVSIDDAQLMSEERLAIVLGAEGNGLSPDTIVNCDYTACIPMSHRVDSLNVAAASAVAFWQLRVR
jgi:tRNA G18 (ribose-2'-O)-methylase SpoU